MLTKRDLVMLEKIVYENIDVNLLSEEYSISNRNIRYIVKNLNFYLKKFKFSLISIKNSKLSINMSELEFEKFLESITEKIYTYSREERERYILIKYLFDDKTTILELEKELNCSRPTIKTDLNNVEKYINNYDLTFVNINNKIFITGNEKKYRHLKFMLLNEKKSNKYLIDIKGNEIILKYREKYYYDFFNIINIIELNQKIEFTKEFKNIMNDYLIITKERISKNFIINKKDNELFLEKLNEFDIISKSFEGVFDKELKYELLHITEYFLSGYYNDRFSEDILKIEKFTTKFVLELKEELDINFNQKFIDGILKYLIPAVYRIKNNLIIKENYELVDSDIYNIIKKIVNKNNKYLKEPLREVEILWLTNYVKEFYNKDKISMVKLLNIIDKYKNNSDLLALELIKDYSKFIDDDRTKCLNGLLDILTIDNIIKVENVELSLNDAVNIGINNLYETNCITEKTNVKFIEIADKYGEYLFFDEKIIFLYDKAVKNCINTGISLIINKNMKVSNNKKADILFLLTSKNKIEHIPCISDIMKLIKNEKIYEILDLNKNNILTFIRNNLD